MTKYNTKFKIKVSKEYIKGQIGFKELSKKVGQEVKIAFISGKMLKGKLLGITSYGSLIELPDDETDVPVVVLKGDANIFVKERLCK